jgi:hypothetical protein
MSEAFSKCEKASHVISEAFGKSENLPATRLSLSENPNGELTSWLALSEKNKRLCQNVKPKNKERIRRENYR